MMRLESIGLIGATQMMITLELIGLIITKWLTGEAQHDLNYIRINRVNMCYTINDYIT